MKALALASTLALALSGCFIVSKGTTNSRSQPATVAEPKNHGQERSEEVHERNAERKAEHDEAKADKGKK
jgi:hypothetical protein